MGDLRSVKMKARDKNPGYADILVRIPLGEDLEAAMPFLVFLQEAGHPVSLKIAQVQARFDEVQNWQGKGDGTE
jgi:hypothetical protein